MSIRIINNYNLILFESISTKKERKKKVVKRLIEIVDRFVFKFFLELNCFIVIYFVTQPRLIIWKLSFQFRMTMIQLALIQLAKVSTLNRNHLPIQWMEKLNLLDKMVCVVILIILIRTLFL